MAQKPAAPPSRKAEPAKPSALKAPAKPVSPAAKPVKKASGTQAEASGNLDVLVNKHLATFRNADKTLAEARALVQTYRERYPELAAYLPEVAAEERAIHLREDAAEAAAGSHQFRIRITGREPRYERKDAGEDEYQTVEATAWLQSFKDHLAVRIAKVILAREAAQALQ
jgi:hypothetical protein